MMNPQTSTVSDRHLGPEPAPSARRTWPLWATLAGVAGFAATVATDLRPPAENEAWKNGEDYTVTAADMASLEPMLGRVGHAIGLIAIVALLVFAASWRRHVEERLDSTAARVVSLGLLASAGGLTLGYGWRGALANYLGPESGMYDSEGLFVYYVLTDFGAYLPWFGAAVSLGAIAWMALAERTVSRILGGVLAVLMVLLTAAMIVTGVPGLPGVIAPMALIVAGIWLTFGRSAAVQGGGAR